jgi:hypothetical protein
MERNDLFNNALEYGIGIYTYNIPLKQRHRMFDYFKTGKIKVMFADTSISVGINLPIRTCILTGNITPTLYNQMGGRAGRRGLDTKGYVIPMFNKELIIDCLLYENKFVSDKIDLKMNLSYLDLIKLLIPNMLSTYYYTNIKKNKYKKITKYQKQVKDINNDFDINLNKKNTMIKNLEDKIQKLKDSDETIIKRDEDNIQLIIKKNNNKISELRDYILNKYFKINDNNNEIIKKIENIKSFGLDFHVISNLLLASDKIETVIFILALINGDLEYIDTEDELILFISSLVFREKGTDYLIDNKILDKLNNYSKLIDVNYDYKEPIDKYLLDFFNHQIYDVKYLENIINFGDWFYIILKQFKRIAPDTCKLKNIIIKTDKKYVYAREVCGISAKKNKKK